MTTKQPTVFISYSHDSAEHIDRVLAFSDRLRSDGIDTILDQYETAPPEGWPQWMERHTRTADFVLVVCTSRYLRRSRGEEEPGVGPGIRWESLLTTQHLYDAGSQNTRFIPVLLAGSTKEHIPTWLSGFSRYDVSTEDGYIKLLRHLTSQPETIKPELGKPPSLPPRERKEDFFKAQPASPLSGEAQPKSGNERTSASRSKAGNRHFKNYKDAIHYLSQFSGRGQQKDADDAWSNAKAALSHIASQLQEYGNLLTNIIFRPHPTTVKEIANTLNDSNRCLQGFIKWCKRQGLIHWLELGVSTDHAYVRWENSKAAAKLSSYIQWLTSQHRPDVQEPETRVQQRLYIGKCLVEFGDDLSDAIERAEH